MQVEPRRAQITGTTPPERLEPSWITGRFGDDVWMARHTKPTRRAPYKLDFKIIPPHFRITAKRFIWAIEYVDDIGSPRSRVRSPQVFHRYFLEIKFLSERAAALGMKRFSEIDRPVLIEIIKERCRKNKRRSGVSSGKTAVSKQLIDTLLGTCNRLHALGPFGLGMMPDGLRWVTKLPIPGVEILEYQPTKLIPEPKAREILSPSLNFFTQYGDMIAALSDLFEKSIACKMSIMASVRVCGHEHRVNLLKSTWSQESIQRFGPRARVLLSIVQSPAPKHFETDGSEVSAIAALMIRKRMHVIRTLLIAACYTNVGFFTGFRCGEILSVRRGDIRAAGSRAEVVSRITKTVKYPEGIPVARVGPQILYDIQLVLERMYATLKRIASSIWTTPRGTSANHNSITYALRLFIAIVVRSDWHFASHQMRRFFAVFYVRRYCGPVDAIS